jgi:hypothetical protein
MDKTQETGPIHRSAGGPCYDCGCLAGRRHLARCALSPAAVALSPWPGDTSVLWGPWSVDVPEYRSTRGLA